MRTKSIAALISAAAFAAFALPASALAASTTVTPAGDSFTLGSASVQINVPTVFVGGECTMSGGTGTVPTAPVNHNASGPVTVTLKTNPKFSNCHWGVLGFPPYEEFMKASASLAAWTVSLQSGSTNTATVNVPVNGLFVEYGNAGCQGSNNAAASLSGKWTNGTASPLVASTMAFAGKYNVLWTNGGGCPWGGKEYSVSVSAAPVSVSDTTNGSKVIQVGP